MNFKSSFSKAFEKSKSLIKFLGFFFRKKLYLQVTIVSPLLKPASWNYLSQLLCRMRFYLGGKNAVIPNGVKRSEKSLLHWFLILSLSTSNMDWANHFVPDGTYVYWIEKFLPIFCSKQNSNNRNCFRGQQRKILFDI